MINEQKNDRKHTHKLQGNAERKKENNCSPFFLLQMPVWGEQEEQIEGCCCSAGSVQARLTLAKTGYVPGEPITYTIDIFNKCDNSIERTELELKQVE